MQANDIWEEAVALTDRVLEVTSGLDLPRGDYWPTFVTVSLVQANERIDGIRVLLSKNYWNDAVILSRSLFELATNVSYVAQHPSDRLTHYLKQGGNPLTREEADELEKELQANDPSLGMSKVPGSSWKRLKDMCCDLGYDWLEDYETFYRYASVPTHAGSFTLGMNYWQLTERQPPSDYQKAATMLTAVRFHLRVDMIASGAFPQQIPSQKIGELSEECQELGNCLSTMRPSVA